MARLWTHWCTNGCGKKVYVKASTTLFTCEKCGKTWKNKKSLLEYWDT